MCYSTCNIKRYCSLRNWTPWNTLYICAYSLLTKYSSVQLPWNILYVYMCILLHFLPSIHQCSFSGTSCVYVHIISLLTKYSYVQRLWNILYICAYYFTSYQVFISVASMELPVYMCILLHFLLSIHQCSFSGTFSIYMHITSLLTKYFSVQLLMEHPVYICTLLHFLLSIHQCSYSGTSCVYIYIYIYMYIYAHYFPSYQVFINITSLTDKLYMCVGASTRSTHISSSFVIPYTYTQQSNSHIRACICCPHQLYMPAFGPHSYPFTSTNNFSSIHPST